MNSYFSPYLESLDWQDQLLDISEEAVIINSDVYWCSLYAKTISHISTFYINCFKVILTFTSHFCPELVQSFRSIAQTMTSQVKNSERYQIKRGT